jgi:hypothetical protein
VTLRPVLFEELEAFNVKNLEERLFRGGLPPALLVQEHDPEFYSEWMDSYFARDVQELFHLEKRDAYGAMIAGSFGSIWFWIPWNQ